MSLESKGPTEAEPIMELSQLAASEFPVYTSSSVSYPYTNHLHLPFNLIIIPNKEATLKEARGGRGRELDGSMYVAVCNNE
jgi:hypothetical protein